MAEGRRGHRGAASHTVLEQELEVRGQVISGTDGLQGGLLGPTSPLRWYSCLRGLPTVSGGRDEQNAEEEAACDLWI